MVGMEFLVGDHHRNHVDLGGGEVRINAVISWWTASASSTAALGLKGPAWGRVMEGGRKAGTLT